MTDSTVRFGLLCSMFQAIGRERSASKKRKWFRTFLDRVYTGRNYFSAVRLILPSLDRERGSYGLKESALAAALVDALAISKDSDDALRLINWRKGGARTGANAGNFALVAADVLQRRQGLASGGLTIGEVNDALDQLALRDGREEKAAVLSNLIKKTNAVEMKWILMVILKDLKLGISEKSIFHEFHPDAEDLFNVTCDLKLVCEKLKDRGQRHKRQDIEVGKAVRPQLAMRISDAAAAWKKFHGKQIVAECKFDGDRIQIHKNGRELHFFSRNFLDHTEYLSGMSDVVLQNILIDRCILDGEMLVWDTSTNRFAEFGSNQEIAKAAMQGLQGDRQECLDVAFDILYAGDTSVIHQSLADRQDLLHRVVKPLKGRLEILMPNDAFDAQQLGGQPFWSITANCVEDVEKFFKETVENRDEGIVLKDLSSKWEPGDRSGKWLKLKPDYIHAGADLDVLIIGGYFGSGRHGGEVAQFLVGLAERSDSTSFPKRFLSFCRVGTGLSDEDLYILITRLKPYLRKNEQPKRSPLCYVVTNNSKERPDVWVESPDKSVILSITSDIRTIKSEVFAAPYSLRFPRIQRVRYDKPWHECLEVESFRDLVHLSNGTTQRGANQGELQQANEEPKRSVKKGDKRNISVISTRSIQLDISSAKKTMLFSNMMFYFANIPPSYSLDYFHKLVVENGGNVSMNLNDTVTHCIAAEKKGIKYQAAVRHRDVIHFSWVLSCCNQNKLVNIQPKYFLFFADSSKKQQQEEVDAFSDYFYWDIDIEDLKQIFCNMIEYGNSSNNLVEHYMKKYNPMRRMGLFHGCFIYLHQIPPWDNSFEVISEMAMRRMKLEISMHGGKIGDDLESATHLLVYSTFESYGFDQIYESIPETQRRLLHRKELHVLRHNWLEESLNKTNRLPEHDYNLRPYSLKKLIVEEKPNPALNDDQNTVASRNTKRGRRAAGRGRAGAGRPALGPARRTRAKIGKHSVKLRSDGSESADSREAAPSADAAAQTKVEEETGSEIADEPDIKQECILENETGDKLGLMTDPIQAMLFDMIPSLSQNQKGRIDADPVSVSCEKKALPETEEEVLNPAKKKKKVSYKDVAGELLKDF